MKENIHASGKVFVWISQACAYFSRDMFLQIQIKASGPTSHGFWDDRFLNPEGKTSGPLPHNLSLFFKYICNVYFLNFFYCCSSTFVSIFPSPLPHPPQPSTLPTLDPTPLWFCPGVLYRCSWKPWVSQYSTVQTTSVPEFLWLTRHAPSSSHRQMLFMALGQT